MIDLITRWQTGHSSMWPATKLSSPPANWSLTNPSSCAPSRMAPWHYLASRVRFRRESAAGNFTFELTNLFPKQPRHTTLGLVDGADIHAQSYRRQSGWATLANRQ